MKIKPITVIGILTALLLIYTIFSMVHINNYYKPGKVYVHKPKEQHLEPLYIQVVDVEDGCVKYRFIKHPEQIFDSTASNTGIQWSNDVFQMYEMYRVYR